MQIEDLIIKNADRIDWDNASRLIDINQIDEDLWNEFIYKWNWNCISSSQILSESFIREFQHKVYWHWISKYQILSEDFIREFQNRVNWQYIYEHQHLSNSFAKEFEKCLPKVEYINIEFSLF